MTTKQSLVKALRQNVVHIPLLVSLFCVAEMHDAVRTWYSWIGIFATFFAYCIYIGMIHMRDERLAYTLANLEEALALKKEMEDAVRK